MATTYYVDGNAGSDGNAGTSFGAAFATIGKLASVMVDGDTGYICASATYTLTSTVTWTVVGTTTNGGLQIIGANASGTFDGTMPTITSATNSVALFTLTAASLHKFSYLKMTHTAGTRGDAFTCLTTSPGTILITNLWIDGCLNGFNGASRDPTSLHICRTTIKNCTASGIVSGASPSNFSDLFIYNNTGSGMTTNGSTVTWALTRCVVAKNGAKGIYDTGTSRNSVFMINFCTIANNTSDGIRSDASTGSMTLIGGNNIVYGNGGWGINYQSLTTTKTQPNVLFDYIFRGSNSSGNYNNVTAPVHDIAVSGDPFTNGASGDFSLDNTSGEGAAIRAAAFNAFYGGLTTAYNDGGAVQHQDSGGSAGMLYVPSLEGI